MLRLYKDQAATEEITDLAPDLLKGSVSVGGNLDVQAKRWIKSDDPALTYEDVEITSTEDPPSGAPSVTITFALDNNDSPGSFAASQELPNGAYTTTYPVWVRAQSNNVQAAFARTDIKYKITQTEFVASP